MPHSAYSLGFTTLVSETDGRGLPVHGVLPEWLSGTLIRTGPARFEVGNATYNHWFDGLAMLHRFDIAAGRVTYSNRYLQSQSYTEAMAKGTISRGEFATDPCRSLFQRVLSWFRPTLTDNGCVNVARWNDAFVALTETRMPVRFDSETLSTVGLREYDKNVRGPISTAHPHYDRARRCHYSYVVDFGRKSKYHVFTIDDSTGRENVVATIPVDRPAYMHSFGMTERFIVLAEFPLVVNPLKLLFRFEPFIRNYRWQPERGVRFHVIDKDSGRVARTAETDAFFGFHHANAYEEGDDVIVDVVAHPDATVIDQLYLERLRSAEPAKASGVLTRFRIGRSQDIEQERLSDALLELPRFDERRRTARPYRFVYGAGQQPNGDFLDRLVKLDLDRGEWTAWQEEGCYPGEPVFVAESDGSDEDAGVILSVVLDSRQSRSCLLILDAATFTELARAEAPHHIPFGFHGNYLAATSQIVR